MILVSCARSPVKEASLALRPTNMPEIQEDWQDFRNDLKAYLESLPTAFYEQSIDYAGTSWSGEEIGNAYRQLALALDIMKSAEDIKNYLNENFVFYEVYGGKNWAEVFITGYFEPLYKGSLRKTKDFPHPAIQKPKDMVRVNLKSFAEEHPQLSPHFDYILNAEKGPRALSGRLIDNSVVPYYSREEIVDNKKFYRSNKAIVWLDPIDLFFLQIQGSGTIQLPNGKEITIGYAAQNGHQYVAIGRFLTDYIPLKEMTAGKIEDYLRSIEKEEMLKILNKNPSYVFFEKRKGRPLTSMGTEVIDGRTIATDSFYFTKGLVGFLAMQDPDNEEATIQRFVFNQDSGGAIKGTHRVDLFWGRGKTAGKIAGRTKQPGKLWFLLPKKMNL